MSLRVGSRFLRETCKDSHSQRAAIYTSSCRMLLPRPPSEAVIAAIRARIPRRNLTVNIIPLWKGQRKQGVRYGASILLSKLEELSSENLDVNFITDEALNEGTSNSNFLQKMENISNSVDVGCGRDLVVNLGGDHGIPIVTIPAMLKRHPDLRVIWVDAHPDINSTETSESGNFHGMPVYYTFSISNTQGAKVDISNLVYVGARDIDSAERDVMEKHSIRNYTKEEIDREGISTVVEQLIERLDLKTHPVHISFDIDALDPSLCPSTGTPVPGGLSVEDVVTIFREVKKTGNLVSCDVVEFNPLIGNEWDVEKTVENIVPVLETLL